MLAIRHSFIVTFTVVADKLEINLHLIFSKNPQIYVRNVIGKRYRIYLCLSNLVSLKITHLRKILP